MTTYRMSNGDRVSKSTIDYRVRETKKELIQDQLEEFGYNFCTDCGKNDCLPIDCSHEKSVDWCQKNGMAELAWDKKNMRLRGRPCHQRKDKNQVGYKEEETNDTE